jgi:translation initiation factor 1
MQVLYIRGYRQKIAHQSTPAPECSRQQKVTKRYQFFFKPCGIWIPALKLLYMPMTMLCLSVMAEVCSTCGLPKDLCVCGEIEKEQQRIRIRLETRKFGRANTIVDGMDEHDSNLADLAQKLKGFCACGGTSKNGQIMLQGDHRERVRQFLIKSGYPEENIELQ